MAHKTLTVSEEAYSALAKLKSQGESFTDVILRLATKKSKGSLLDYVRSLDPDEDFARILEEIVKSRQTFQIRRVQF